jgi:hypothetical protein
MRARAKGFRGEIQSSNSEIGVHMPTMRIHVSPAVTRMILNHSLMDEAHDEFCDEIESKSEQTGRSFEFYL